MYRDKKGIYRETVYINGKRKVFSGKTKKDALLKMALFNIQQKDSLSFETVAEMWKEDNWEKLKFGSYRTYKPCLDRAVLKFGKTAIDKIKPVEVQTWLRDLGQQYAHKTVANHKSIVSQVCDYAIVNLGVDMWNPCDRVKLPSGLKKGTRNALSHEERQAILSTTKNELQLAFLILFTGCRLGEALALQMKDVDMKKNEIHISKSVAFHGNQPVIQSTKTENGIRTVPLLPPLKERLQELKLPTEAFIVSGEKPMTKSALYRRWEKFCKDKGISIDRHSIRHQYATTLYEAGIEPKSAQELLGHAQISTTMDIYTHISEEKKLKDYVKLATYVANND